MPMRIRTAVWMLLNLILLTACSAMPRAAGHLPEQYHGQTAAQLHLPAEEPEPVSEQLYAVWIPYFTVEKLLAEQDEALCRKQIAAYLQNLQELGINTVFVHVCAFGESSYPSAYYPLLPGANGHDTMQIFSDICRELHLSVHAWINPLRLQNAEYMQVQSGDSVLHAWYLDENKHSSSLSLWENRYYLNPAAESTHAFLKGVIHELMTRYHPDGIHIDDYFYPTAETAWDAAEFAASGADDLAAWRKNNITALMRTMYQAVHDADANAVFSVSPQGKLPENVDHLYADVPAWLQSDDICDLVIPQIYFGYENESSPFSETLDTWLHLPRSKHVRMAVGLAAYKIGQPDHFAGSGSLEWQQKSGILEHQLTDAAAIPDLCGVSFYHADALNALSPDEAEAIRKILIKT